MEGSGGVAAVGGAGGISGGAGFEFGVDPSMDPELALVRIKISNAITMHGFTNYA
jgi:hypothetical protein